MNADDYVTEFNAGIKAANEIIELVQAEPGRLGRLTWGLRSAVADANGGGAHGVGFIDAVAMRACRFEYKSLKD